MHMFVFPKVFAMRTYETLDPEISRDGVSCVAPVQNVKIFITKRL